MDRNEADPKPQWSFLYANVYEWIAGLVAFLLIHSFFAKPSRANATRSKSE